LIIIINIYDSLDLLLFY